MEYLFSKKHSFVELIAFGYIAALYATDKIGFAVFILLCAVIGGIGAVFSGAVEKK